MLKKISFALFVLRKWLPSYLAQSLRGRPKPAHIMFCMTDHFEPGTGGVSASVERARMDLLLKEYPKMADAFKDSGGNRPKRTWFFPPHYHRRGNLRDLAELCQRGYGEVELHLHHGKTTPDSETNLEHTIRLCLDDYSKFGTFGTENGQKRYGFVHGDWALANSRFNCFCGVDNEIEVLCRTGCYADFTMPAPQVAECNPKQINSIFYAKNDPRKRIPYDRGFPAECGVKQRGDLLLIQGPLHPWFVNKSPLGFRAFNDAVAKGKPATPRKVDCWVATWIHVKGKPDWVIVKVHTHGAVDAEVVLGETMSRTLQHFQAAYNDGKRFRLHYVTARELYNIVKAAEAGESGDPEEYRNYKVLAPQYDASPAIVEASSELQEAVARTYAG